MELLTVTAHLLTSAVVALLKRRALGHARQAVGTGLDRAILPCRN